MNENIINIILDRIMIVNPGEKPFLNLDGFVGFIKSIELLTAVDEAMIGRYFNLSLSIVVNETGSDAHTKMRHKLEFVEAFARLVDQASMP